MGLGLGVVDRWLSNWWYDWFVGNGCVLGYVCCVGGSCIWWFMLLMSGSLDWSGCMVGGIRYWDDVVVVVVLGVFGFVCRCGGG